ncbi:MAG: hypothetical protein ACI8QC_001059 [Planctomycetota bacterium]|jgi:hypothetical protein
MMRATPLRITSRSTGWIAGLLGALALASCSQESNTIVGLGAPGESLQNGATGQYIFVDPSEGGARQQIRLSNVAFGRIVRVFGQSSDDVNSARVEMRQEFVIGGNNSGLSSNWLIETNSASGEESLFIFENVNTTSGLAAFHTTLQALGNSLDPVFDGGFASAGVFTMVPRNSVMVLRFDDLLDASTINGANLRVNTGVPAVIPFDSRILPDPNYGDIIDRDGDGTSEFYTTRILVDMAVTEIESFLTNPPLVVNNSGLPASVDSNLSNLQVRIPTVKAPVFGQTTLISNLTGHTVASLDNGTVDFGAPTRDLVRAARSGGPNNITGDPYNGFLRDDVAPEIMAALNAQVTGSITQNTAQGNNVFTLDSLAFGSVYCAQLPTAGDLLKKLTPNVVAEVISSGILNADGTADFVMVRLLAYPSEWTDLSEFVAAGVGPVQFLSAYDAVADENQTECFLTTFPASGLISGVPGQDMLNSASMGVRFSEPMDVTSVTAFDSMLLTRKDPNAGILASFDYVVGTIGQTQGLRDFSFTPDLPLAHDKDLGTPLENYYLSVLASGDPLGTAPTDLAGNALAASPGPLSANIAEAAPEAINGGRVSRFRGTDDEPPIAPDDEDPYAEWQGQHVYLTQNGTIKPRPVVRYQGVADNTNDLVGAMTASLNGVTEPLSRFGSKTQMMWRYADVGLDLLNLETGLLRNESLNIDIEGMNWVPRGGQVAVDNFGSFEMRMSHSFNLPDEPNNVPLQIVSLPNSGVADIFQTNLLDETNDPQVVVHDRTEGYFVNPGDKYQTGGGTTLLPFPMNTGVAPDDFRYFTWRDTAIQTRGGQSGIGAPLGQWHIVLGIPFPVLDAMDGMGCIVPVPQFYPDTQVQTAALPLLTEFRCFPDDGASSVNNFDVSLAVSFSTRPYFRAFSAGGIDVNGNSVQRDPELEAVANGGFNPMSTPIPGVPTFGRDNLVYLGAMDFVVRVSRSYSVWWPIEESVNNTFPTSNFSPPTVEPDATEQPAGTSIQVAARGATTLTAIAGGPGDLGFDLRSLATSFDPYGNYYIYIEDSCFPNTNMFPWQVHDAAAANPGVGFLQAAGSSWYEDMSGINNANYYQMRVSFVSNTQTGLSPSLSALALTWTK